MALAARPDARASSSTGDVRSSWWSMSMVLERASTSSALAVWLNSPTTASVKLWPRGHVHTERTISRIASERDSRRMQRSSSSVEASTEEESSSSERVVKLPAVPLGRLAERADHRRDRRLAQHLRRGTRRARAFVDNSRGCMQLGKRGKGGGVAGKFESRAGSSGRLGCACGLCVTGVIVAAYLTSRIAPCGCTQPK